MKILIVDDEPAMRMLLTEILEETGCELLEAENGADARAIIAENEINLIITDLVMPIRNGLDLIAELHKDKNNIPIIAISGGGSIAGRFDYLEISKLIGADSILSKPFQAYDILERVKMLLPVLQR